MNAMFASTHRFVEPEIGNTKLKLQLDSGFNWTIISTVNWKILGSGCATVRNKLSASGDPLKS